MKDDNENAIDDNYSSYRSKKSIKENTFISDEYIDNFEEEKQDIEQDKNLDDMNRIPSFDHQEKRLMSTGSGALNNIPGKQTGSRMIDSGESNHKSRIVNSGDTNKINFNQVQKESSV